jgi:hypothetical protein
MISAVVPVELLQPLAQPVSLDPRNGVLSSVEGGLGPAKNLGCDVVLVQLIDLTCKILLAEVAHQPRKPRGPRQCLCYRIEFVAFCLFGGQAGIIRHYVTPARSARHRWFV